MTQALALAEIHAARARKIQLTATSIDAARAPAA
jgi:hypothetical protein